MIDAFKRASALRSRRSSPYYGYARQDRSSHAPRAHLGQAGGRPDHDGRGAPRPDGGPARRADPGFFDIPVDNLVRRPVILRLRGEEGPCDLVVVSPDAGGVASGRAFAKRLNATGHHRQAPPGPERGQGDEHHRGVSLGATSSCWDDLVDTAGVADRERRGAPETGGPAGSWRPARTRFCRGARRNGSTIPPSTGDRRFEYHPLDLQEGDVSAPDDPVRRAFSWARRSAGPNRGGVDQFVVCVGKSVVG